MYIRLLLFNPLYIYSYSAKFSSHLHFLEEISVPFCQFAPDDVIAQIISLDIIAHFYFHFVSQDSWFKSCLYFNLAMLLFMQSSWYFYFDVSLGLCFYAEMLCPCKISWHFDKLPKSYTGAKTKSYLCECLCNIIINAPFCLPRTFFMQILLPSNTVRDNFNILSGAHVF